jgi:hypothetical protein
MSAESPASDSRMVRLDEVNPVTIPWLPAPIARATMYRYAAGGAGKPRLRTYRISQHRYTTGNDLREFLSESTIGNQPAAPRPAARQRSIERAKRVLEEAGI